MKNINQLENENNKLQAQIKERETQIAELRAETEQTRRDYAAAELDGKPSAKMLEGLEKLQARHAAAESVITVARERIAENLDRIKQLHRAQLEEKAAEIDARAREKAQALTAALWEAHDLIKEINGIAWESVAIDRDYGIETSARILKHVVNDTAAQRLHALLLQISNNYAPAFEKSGRIPR